MRKSKRGFTLVELSIVLVIIGLLIGGILVAQSMIGTVKIQSFVREVQQYDVAVSNFKTKFKGLPGDARVFGGNGNRLIDAPPSTGPSCSPCGDEQFAGETANFWVSLQQGGGFTYHGKTFTSTVPAGGFDTSSNNPNSPNPPTDVKNAGVVGSECSSITGSTTWTNCYLFADWSGTDPSSTTDLDDGATFGGNGGSADGKPIFTPANALAIDQKMDDGKPGSGHVVNAFSYDPASNNGSYPGCDNFPTGFYGSGSNSSYVTANTGVQCFMRIDMLSQVGQ